MKVLEVYKLSDEANNASFNNVVSVLDDGGDSVKKYIDDSRVAHPKQR